MNSLQLYRELSEQLKAVSDCPDFEAKCILEHFLNLKLSDIYTQKEIIDDLSEINKALNKRLANIPLQYILGKWEFMGREFIVNENVLIPRPETEILCECLADKINENSVVYDLCSGTGCIAISVEKSTGAAVYAFEKYDGAFELLNENIKLNGSKVIPIKCDICLKPDFDIPKADFILSNPPYIKSGDISGLQKEVLKEPESALDGGEDGYDFYRAISKNFSPLLNIGGMLALEMGEGQEDGIINIFSDLTHIQTLKDYNGIKRVLIFRKENI